MKKIAFVMCAISIALFMNSCKTSTTGDKLSITTGGENTTESWSGIYTGTLPCADCSGILTKIELNKDYTYMMKTQYLDDESQEVFSDSGTFQWNDQTNTITLSGDDLMVKQCLIEGNQLFVLLDGKRRTGELANNYILTKVDLALVEKYWKLIELNGKPVVPQDNIAKEPYITFKMDGNRFIGNAGCNNITGSYQLKGLNRITLSQPASTMMMCMSMETENQFLKMLNSVDSYTVKNDTLILNRARMAPLAVFVVVNLR